MIHPEDDGKGNIHDLIVDDGGDMTLLIYEGKNAEDLFLKDGTIPDPSFTENVEFKIFQTTIKHQLEGGEMDKRKKSFNTCMGVSEETFTGVHHAVPLIKHCVIKKGPSYGVSYLYAAWLVSMTLSPTL